MSDQNELVVQEPTELAPVDQTKENRELLKQQAQELLNQITATKNRDKERELTDLFNSNHAKKAMIRQTEFDEVQDALLTTLKKRVLEHPDHFSEDELVKAITAIQGVMDKNATRSTVVEEQQLIQINNPVTVNTATENLSKASRDKVSEFIKLVQQAQSTPTTEEPNNG